VTLMTHDSFAATQSVIDDFQRQTRVTLSVLKGGDAGTMVNQAILTKDDPLGDVLYGVDNTFLSRALDAGIFVPYLSPSSSSVPAELKTDPQNRVTPIDYGDVCINYDRQAFGVGTPPPARIEDLTRAEYKSKLVVENPATSSPGLAFVLATIVRFGETGDYTWLDYWRDLRANDLLVVSDWNDAYYNQFSGGAGAGDRPLVVSYATSPAAEIYFAEEPLDVGDGPTANLDDGCFRQIEFAGVLAGASNSVGAQQWIDFMASPEFQSDMPLNMFVFPVNPAAAVPDLWLQVPSKATQPLTMDLAQIAANRDRWIGEWTDVVIH
jgi:thiamine transport system substrate-binding protein